MSADHTTLNTAFLLMAQYHGKAVIPVEDVCRDYFSHLDPAKFVRKVGAGEIAESKIHSLLTAGARVTVVSPEAKPDLVALAREGRLTWHRRDYAESDLDVCGVDM